MMDMDRKWQPRSLLLIIIKSALMTTMVFLLTMKYSIIRKCDVNLHTHMYLFKYTCFTS